MTTKVSSTLSQWYDQRPQRERLVLLVCAVVILILLLRAGWFAGPRMSLKIYEK